MKRSTIAISCLIVALIASNAWAVYKIVDVGVTLHYSNGELKESQEALSQALAIIKVSSAPGVTRSQIVDAAKKALPDVEPFEKDGYLWVGRLGLRFDPRGRLVEVVPS